LSGRIQIRLANFRISDFFNGIVLGNLSSIKPDIMKKWILMTALVTGIGAVSFAMKPADHHKKPATHQEPEGKQKTKTTKKTKRTGEEKRMHAEQKSKGKAYSGNGNGPSKSQSTKTKTKTKVKNN
jgi:hypothetical protein